MSELRKTAPNGSTHARRDGDFFYKIEDDQVFFYIDDTLGWHKSEMTSDFLPNNDIAELWFQT